MHEHGAGCKPYVTHSVLFSFLFWLFICLWNVRSLHKMNGIVISCIQRDPDCGIFSVIFQVFRLILNWFVHSQEFTSGRRMLSRLLFGNAITIDANHFGCYDWRRWINHTKHRVSVKRQLNAAIWCKCQRHGNWNCFVFHIADSSNRGELRIMVMKCGHMDATSNVRPMKICQRHPCHRWNPIIVQLYRWS